MTTSGTLPALRTPLVLSGFAFVVLWEKLDLGALPRALYLPSPGATVEERARVEHVAAVELARLGLGSGGPPDHELAATLRLLAAPATEYYGWVVPSAGRPVGMLAAESGRQAVLATVDVPIVELMPVTAGDLARIVAHQLPPLAPAGAVHVLPEHSLAGFERATGAPVTGNGQLYVAVRDRIGRRRQAPHMIEYVDTPAGRWLLRREPGGTTAGPGGAEAIAAELDTAHRLLLARPEPRSHR
jgi:hypothetical protein